MQYYAEKTKSVEKDLSTSVNNGLESKDAKSRLEKYGLNELKRAKKINPIKIFFDQFKSIVIYILIAAVIISIFLGEIIDSVVILVILIFNAVFGFIQEYKAEKSIEALKKMASLKAKVIRDGKEILIEARDVVPGDVLVLEEGDKVPADCRLFEVVRLETQEASLTGESTPVNKTDDIMKKDTILAERKNCVYAGTIITKGRGKGVVIGTGMKTELGKIAKLIQDTEQELTPLQHKLDSLGRWLGFATIFICVIVFIVGILRGGSMLEMFLAAVALAVAAIPEGLPAVVTISLALGVRRMIKRNALVRKLPSVETLGCTTVICSDKTGTLTKNEMTVKKIFMNNNIVEVSGAGYTDDGNFMFKDKKVNPEQFEMLLKIGALNNSALEKGTVIGDPTEGCLIVSARKGGLDREKLEKECKRVDELPFDSERKMMSTVHLVSGKKMVYTKGAPDMIINCCTHILENGKVRKLSDKDKKFIYNVNDGFAKDALRVLGFAYKPLKLAEKAEEKKLIFVGLQAMIDPPRESVKDSIKRCHDAGIKVVMITGDHEITARAIAKELGIGDRSMCGKDLDEKEDLHNIVKNIDIYARVNPEHKLKIVDALRKNGHVVAMTGDGVNDAPALKKADIGIAMGITGTDVSKEASDMVLVDDHFSSIVNAVEEGRGIYDNIKKFVNYMLSSNLGEVLVLFVAMLIGFKDSMGGVVIPIIAIQILWINLVTDGLPALALGVDPISRGIMQRNPRSPKEHIVSANMGVNVLLIGIMICVISLILFNKGLSEDVVVGRTMVFTALVVMETVRVVMIRSQYNVGFLSNKYLIGALFVSLLLQLAVVYTPLNIIFKTAPLGLVHWMYIIIGAVSMMIVGMGANFLIKRITREVD